MAIFKHSESANDANFIDVADTGVDACRKAELEVEEFLNAVFMVLENRLRREGWVDRLGRRFHVLGQFGFLRLFLIWYFGFIGLVLIVNFWSYWVGFDSELLSKLAFPFLISW